MEAAGGDAAGGDADDAGGDTAGGATEAEADTEVTNVVGAGAAGAPDTLLLCSQRSCLRWACGWTAAAVLDNTRVESARGIAEVFIVAGVVMLTEVCRMFRGVVYRLYVWFREEKLPGR